MPRVFWKCPSKEESTKNDYKHSETRIWHRLNPKEGEGEPGEETKESEGDNSGRGSGRTISGPSDKGECSGVQTKKACTKPLISDISNDEEDSNVNKSFMNNSSDTESSHSSDFGDLLKPKKRRTHK